MLGGQIGAGDAMDAVRRGGQIAWMQGRAASPSTSHCVQQPEEPLSCALVLEQPAGVQATPQMSRGAGASVRGCNPPAEARQRQVCAMRWRLAAVKIAIQDGTFSTYRYDLSQTCSEFACNKSENCSTPVCTQ